MYQLHIFVFILYILSMTYHSVYFVVFFVPYNIKVVDLTNYIPVVTIYEKLVELPHMHK